MPASRAVSQAEVLGDWNDVDAAMETGLFRGECAIVRRDEVSSGEVYFEVRSVSDEPGWVRVRRLEGAGSEERAGGEAKSGGNEALRTPPPLPTVRAPALSPVRIAVEVSIGRFSNRQREQRLIDGFASRLRRLSGVDYAPAED